MWLGKERMMDSGRIATYKPSRWAAIRDEYRNTLTPLPHDPALWFLAGVWLLAALVLTLLGFGSWAVNGLVILMMSAVSIALVILLTLGGPPVPAPEAPRKGRVWAQLGVILLFIVLTGQAGMVFHHALPARLTTIPLWTPFLAFLSAPGRLGQFPPTFITNPVTYFILPMIGLLALGARWGGLGFRWGYRSWLVVAVLSLASIISIGAGLLAGHVAVFTLLVSVFSNAVQNGFFEEFLFRGALMTRLTLLLNSRWAIVLSSLAFGLWHLGLNTERLGGNLIAGAALGILFQGVPGLSFAVVFWRTHSIVASSVIHVLGNVAG
jgi:membrane protease YdiL (CAAX protease family)